MFSVNMLSDLFIAVARAKSRACISLNDREVIYSITLLLKHKHILFSLGDGCTY